MRRTRWSSKARPSFSSRDIWEGEPRLVKAGLLRSALLPHCSCFSTILTENSRPCPTALLQLPAGAVAVLALQDEADVAAVLCLGLRRGRVGVLWRSAVAAGQVRQCRHPHATVHARHPRYAPLRMRFEHLVYEGMPCRSTDADVLHVEQGKRGA
jgi:hypothetical protein